MHLSTRDKALLLSAGMVSIATGSYLSHGDVFSLTVGLTGSVVVCFLGSSYLVGRNVKNIKRTKTQGDNFVFLICPLHDNILVTPNKVLGGFSPPFLVGERNQSAEDVAKQLADMLISKTKQTGPCHLEKQSEYDWYGVKIVCFVFHMPLRMTFSLSNRLEYHFISGDFPFHPAGLISPLARQVIAFSRKCLGKGIESKVPLFDFSNQAQVMILESVRTGKMEKWEYGGPQAKQLSNSKYIEA